MDITEVKTIILRDSNDKKLKAYATLTIDNCFVVRNVKVIEGNKGLFVAMPSRKLKESCPKCGHKNALRSKFCNQCGSSLPPVQTRTYQDTDDRSRQSEHRDIAHPITVQCREYIQKKVLEAYNAELQGGGRAGSDETRRSREGGRRHDTRQPSGPDMPAAEAPEPSKQFEPTIGPEGDIEL